MAEITTLEKRIVSLLQSKSKQAVELIYNNYGEALYGVVLNIVGNEEIAQDTLQDGFVKVWKNAARYDKSRGRLFTWLLNIFRTTAIDKIRSKAYKQEKQNLSIENSVYTTKAYQMNVDRIGVKEILSKIPAEYAELIDYAYFKGYTHKEIAEKLNIPLGTIKTRIRAAILKLKDHV